MATRSPLARFLAALSATLALGLSAVPAEACSMLPPGPRPSAAEADRAAREALQRADAVIEFEVVEGNGAGDGTIRVLQSAKGPYAAGTVLPARPVDGAACGPGRLVTGQRHLIFLSNLPPSGEAVIVWRLASPDIRAALVRLGLLDR